MLPGRVSQWPATIGVWSIVSFVGITQRLFARDSRRGGRDGAQNGGGSLIALDGKSSRKPQHGPWWPLSVAQPPFPRRYDTLMTATACEFVRGGRHLRQRAFPTPNGQGRACADLPNFNARKRALTGGAVIRMGGGHARVQSHEPTSTRSYISTCVTSCGVVEYAYPSKCKYLLRERSD